MPLDPANVPGLGAAGWTFDMVQHSDKQSTRPDYAFMQQLLSSLQSHPQSWAFLQPVNGEEVTDYYDFIKKPMGRLIISNTMNFHKVRADFNTMEHKLTHNLYDNLKGFLDDARLVFQNCLLYNPEGSVYAKNAITMQKFLDDQVAAVGPSMLAQE